MNYKQLAIHSNPSIKHPIAHQGAAYTYSASELPVYNINGTKYAEYSICFQSMKISLLITPKNMVIQIQTNPYKPTPTKQYYQVGLRGDLAEITSHLTKIPTDDHSTLPIRVETSTNGNEFHTHMNIYSYETDIHSGKSIEKSRNIELFYLTESIIQLTANGSTVLLNNGRYNAELVEFISKALFEMPDHYRSPNFDYYEQPILYDFNQSNQSDLADVLIDTPLPHPKSQRSSQHYRYMNIINHIRSILVDPNFRQTKIDNSLRFYPLSSRNDAYPHLIFDLIGNKIYLHPRPNIAIILSPQSMKSYKTANNQIIAIPIDNRFYISWLPIRT